MFKKLLAMIDVAKYIRYLLAIAVVVGTGYYLVTKLKLQSQQIEVLTEYVETVKKQNDMIVAANEAITADMKVIKEGIETYNSNIAGIKDSASRLSRQLNDLNFRKMLKEEISKAQTEYNRMYNDYLKSINDDTKKFSK